MFFSQELIDDATSLVNSAGQKNIIISCAESCTGGLLSALITEISGASKIFDCSFVTYSNFSKEKLLDIPPELLAKYGAVSAETAREMAIGANKFSASTLSISITGIAGPDGGSESKPVGLVYIASHNKINNRLIIEQYNFAGDRYKIRLESVSAAIKILIKQLND